MTNLNIADWVIYFGHLVMTTAWPEGPIEKDTDKISHIETMVVAYTSVNEYVNIW